jgi:hypothetical protein
MHREPLTALLRDYLRDNPAESPVAERFLALVTQHADCFERSCMPGHVTASAFIVSAEQDRFLLTHHRKLNKWLQLGGHADGDPDALRVASKEAREESGMLRFEALGPGGDVAGDAQPVLDIDIHAIPARKNEPAHDHYDVRFLLRAGSNQALVMSDESTDLAWFPMSGAAEIEGRESIARLWRKARHWLAPG